MATEKSTIVKCPCSSSTTTTSLLTRETLFFFSSSSSAGHGRVAMLAVVGYLTQAVFRLPGYIVPPGTKIPGTIDLDGTTFDAIPNGVAAIGAVSSLGWLQIITLIGYMELIAVEKKEGSYPGDYGFNFLPFIKEEQQSTYRLRELQNGRIAMLGAMELIVHDLTKPVGESLFTIQHF